jgi:SSS family solute:Na+ symporter
MTAMTVGFIIGALRIVLELSKESLSGFLYSFATINFLYFCILLFVFSIALMVVVSLMSPEPSEEQLKGLTYATTVAEDKARSRASWNAMDVILSIIVVVIIIGVFAYFSPLGVG